MTLKDNRVCDGCNTSHGRDGAGWFRVIQDGNLEYRLDLCNQCAEAFCDWVDRRARREPGKYD